MKKVDKFWLLPLLMLIYVALTPYVYGLSALQAFRSAQGLVRISWIKARNIFVFPILKQTQYVCYKFFKAGQH